jgi:thioredoxin-dependent peroxiredoxin
MNVGDRVPAFTLKNQHGDAVASDTLWSKGPAVLFFYPKDETPVCTAEVCAFRDAYEDFSSAGAAVVGISSDSVESHVNFAGKHRLPFVLLADIGGAVRRQLQVPRGMLGLAEGRVTYVVDKRGIVRHRFSAMLQAQKHVDEAVQVIRSLPV